MDQMHEQYQQAFLKLKRTYIYRLENTIRIIDNIFDLEKYKMPTRDDLLRAQALVHGLAGSGATFGYPQITEVGREVDHFLHEILGQGNQEHEISDEDLVDLDRLLKKVQRVCQGCCDEAHREIPEFANANKATTYRPAGKAHVLVVDDDREVASAISHGLESFGMTVQMSGSGEDALHYLARTQPDMVVLDIALKGMDGLEVLQQIKQNSEFIDIPVVILSTRHNKTDEEWSMRAGALAYVHKPIDVPSFSRRIVKLIGETRAHAQSI